MFSKRNQMKELLYNFQVNFNEIFIQNAFYIIIVNSFQYKNILENGRNQLMCHG